MNWEGTLYHNKVTKSTFLHYGNNPHYCNTHIVSHMILWWNTWILPLHINTHTHINVLIFHIQFGFSSNYEGHYTVKKTFQISTIEVNHRTSWPDFHSLPKKPLGFSAGDVKWSKTRTSWIWGRDSDKE